MRILVVDDDPAVRRSIDRALRLEGYDVVGVGLGWRGARGAGPGATRRPGPRPRAARHRRADGVPAHAQRRRRHPGADADGPRRRRRPGAGLDAGRRRLPGQALRPGGAAGPAARPAAPPLRGRGRPAAGGRPHPGPLHPRGQRGERSLRADPHRVRPARDVPAPPAPGAHPRGALRPGLGLRLRLGHQLARRLRRLPPAQDSRRVASRAASRPCAAWATCCGTRDLPHPARPGDDGRRRGRRAGRLARRPSSWPATRC